jgi:hypothetical protein
MKIPGSARGRDTTVELTMTIARENASSKSNRALRIPSQGFWTQGLA